MEKVTAYLVEMFQMFQVRHGMGLNNKQARSVSFIFFILMF